MKVPDAELVVMSVGPDCLLVRNHVNQAVTRLAPQTTQKNEAIFEYTNWCCCRGEDLDIFHIIFRTSKTNPSSEPTHYHLSYAAPVKNMLLHGLHNLICGQKSRSRELIWRTDAELFSL
jgi:hypothetical protein